MDAPIVFTRWQKCAPHVIDSRRTRQFPFSLTTFKLFGKRFLTEFYKTASQLLQSASGDWYKTSSLLSDWSKMHQSNILLSDACSNQFIYTTNTNTTTITTILRPFFRDHPREPVPEENLWTGKINRGRHTNHPVGHHSIRTKQCPRPSSPPFFTGRMLFLPSNQQCQSIEVN